MGARLGGGGGGQEKKKGRKRRPKKKKGSAPEDNGAEGAAAAAATAATASPANAETAAKPPAATTMDPSKRAKKLRKSLKQIASLKEKDVTSLNEDQKKKLQSETELRAELDALVLEHQV